MPRPPRPGKYKLPNGLRLPNEGSKRQTPASLKIDLHYEHLHIWGRWTWERFVTLCKFLNLTAEELASVACIPHASLAQFERQNHLYAGRGKNRSAALVLTMIEGHAMKAYTTDVVSSPFPNV